MICFLPLSFSFFDASTACSMSLRTGLSLLALLIGIGSLILCVALLVTKLFLIQLPDDR